MKHCSLWFVQRAQRKRGQEVHWYQATSSQAKQVGSFGGEAVDGGEVMDGVAGLGKDGCARNASKSSENGSKVSNMSGESVFRGL